MWESVWLAKHASQQPISTELTCHTIRLLTGCGVTIWQACLELCNHHHGQLEHTSHGLSQLDGTSCPLPPCLGQPLLYFLCLQTFPTHGPTSDGSYDPGLDLGAQHHCGLQVMWQKAWSLLSLLLCTEVWDCVLPQRCPQRILHYPQCCSRWTTGMSFFGG